MIDFAKRIRFLFPARFATPAPLPCTRNPEIRIPGKIKWYSTHPRPWIQITSGAKSQSSTMPGLSSSICFNMIRKEYTWFVTPTNIYTDSFGITCLKTLSESHFFNLLFYNTKQLLVMNSIISCYYTIITVAVIMEPVSELRSGTG